MSANLVSASLALRLVPLVLAALIIPCAAFAAQPDNAGRPDAMAPRLAGTWSLSLDKNGASCRVMLLPQRADSGDYFLGMPASCRHAMPGLQRIGRWSMPDAGHLTLDDPTGQPILTMNALAGGTFSVQVPEGTYAMMPMGNTGRSVSGFEAVDARSAGGFATVQPIASRRKVEAAPDEIPSELAGRYAVMREKRDTGCMVTLDDKSRVKGGERAQLAPGCRDQGIVIFDPSAWQLIKGQLVLTARAGHKAVLEKKQEGLWEKDSKDGGKPLGLKKL